MGDLASLVDEETLRADFVKSAVIDNRGKYLYIRSLEDCFLHIITERNFVIHRYSDMITENLLEKFSPEGQKHYRENCHKQVSQITSTTLFSSTTTTLLSTSITTTLASKKKKPLIPPSFVEQVVTKEIPKPKVDEESLKHYLTTLFQDTAIHFEASEAGIVFEAKQSEMVALIKLFKSHPQLKVPNSTSIRQIEGKRGWERLVLSAGDKLPTQLKSLVNVFNDKQPLMAKIKDRFPPSLVDTAVTSLVTAPSPAPASPLLEPKFADLSLLPPTTTPSENAEPIKLSSDELKDNICLALCDPSESRIKVKWSSEQTFIVYLPALRPFYEASMKHNDSKIFSDLQESNNHDLLIKLLHNTFTRFSRTAKCEINVQSVTAEEGTRFIISLKADLSRDDAKIINQGIFSDYAKEDQKLADAKRYSGKMECEVTLPAPSSRTEAQQSTQVSEDTSLETRNARKLRLEALRGNFKEAIVNLIKPLIEIDQADVPNGEGPLTAFYREKALLPNHLNPSKLSVFSVVPTLSNNNKKWNFNFDFRAVLFLSGEEGNIDPIHFLTAIANAYNALLKSTDKTIFTRNLD